MERRRVPGNPPAAARQTECGVSTPTAHDGSLWCTPAGSRVDFFSRGGVSRADAAWITIDPPVVDDDFAALTLDDSPLTRKNARVLHSQTGGTMHIGALRFGLGLSVALAIAGCGNSDPGEGGEEGGDDPEELVFVPGQGQVAAPRLAYPEGPKGISPGSVIENFKFVGYVNAMNNPTGQLQIVQLADFYNPTGNEVYPEGSAFAAGTPKPKALLISVASVWCGPCKFEAAEILPGLYAEYKPMGGEFLLQLADSATAGEPATVKNLDNWTNAYDVDYPATIDPSYKLDALFDQSAFPQNFIIDTRTMRIAKVMAGAAEEGSSFWTMYEKVLAGTW
jgi:hypothetical protein